MPRLGRLTLLAAALAVASPVALIPSTAPAQNILEMLFGGGAPQRPQQRSASPPQANFFADPFGLNQQQAPPPAPSRPVASGGGPAFCVRPCDGKYFALQTRGGMTPAQMCTMFCPAGNAKVYYGSNIDYATAAGGQRYADSDNAYAYRKALKPDCTCNGRDPAGLAQIDLSQDTSLRPGDIVATATGLAAYNGIRLGAEQTPDFTPVADYPGLTSQLRAKLGEMKVAPVGDQPVEDAASARDVSAPIAPAKPVPGRRAAAGAPTHSID
ncbi:DUF2865 domain-containing protein [Rhodopseudomonas palustris]|uniref:DUF2865 domain-containing protein n=1 Tax=Rhodopseudomonas palustris TaxID=1076 RepID=A0A418UYA2_RHOPL|nr:DUF2865 domain-containing protein [Rhodopseudomonas palustris]RJF67383.1 DUF2865 domain-containing protein [Rhodopseudomonas palustris]